MSLFQAFVCIKPNPKNVRPYWPENLGELCNYVSSLRADYPVLNTNAAALTHVFFEEDPNIVFESSTNAIRDSGTYLHEFPEFQVLREKKLRADWWRELDRARLPEELAGTEDEVEMLKYYFSQHFFYPVHKVDLETPALYKDLKDSLLTCRLSERGLIHKLNERSPKVLLYLAVQLCRAWSAYLNEMFKEDPSVGVNLTLVDRALVQLQPIYLG